MIGQMLNQLYVPNEMCLGQMTALILLLLNVKSTLCARRDVLRSNDYTTTTNNNNNNKM